MYRKFPNRSLYIISTNIQYSMTVLLIRFFGFLKIQNISGSQDFVRENEGFIVLSR